MHHRRLDDPEKRKRVSENPLKRIQNKNKSLFSLSFDFSYSSAFKSGGCPFIDLFLSICKDFYLRKFKTAQNTHLQAFDILPSFRVSLKKFANILFQGNPEIICEKMELILKNESGNHLRKNGINLKK